MPRRKKQKQKIRFEKRRIVIAILLTLIVGLVALFLKVISAGEDVFAVAVAKDNGDVEVLMADFTKPEVYSVRVPAGTEVNLAMQRGVLRASSIWRLIKSENLPGQLLADTIMRTFYIPVDYWADEEAVSSLFSGTSDMPFPLRVRLLTAVKSSNVTFLDLSETTYFTKLKLADGESGFRVNGTLPLTVASIAADGRISGVQTAVLIKNRTGRPSYMLSPAVSVFEVLGGKVAPLLTGDEEGIGCTVKAEKPQIRKRVATVFNCKEMPGTPDSFDIEVVFGKLFLDRF